MTVRETWERLCPAPFASDLFETLDSAYTSPGRSYHGWRHIAECLELLELYSQSAPLRNSDYSHLQYALFYHDVVYDPSGVDNELASARLAADELGPVLERPEIEAITRLILATRHLAGGEDRADDHPLAPVIVDIDLAILGAPRSRFVEYDLQIRREYAAVDPARFAAGRRSILEQFLARDSIYQTSFFASRFESAARRNIAYALVRFCPSPREPL